MLDEADPRYGSRTGVSMGRRSGQLPPTLNRHLHTVGCVDAKGVKLVGTFGAYTQWAVVFLIIFVLFFLFVPVYGAGAGAAY